MHHTINHDRKWHHERRHDMAEAARHGRHVAVLVVVVCALLIVIGAALLAGWMRLIAG